MWKATVCLYDLAGRARTEFLLSMTHHSLGKAMIWGEGVASAMTEQATASRPDLARDGFYVTIRFQPLPT